MAQVNLSILKITGDDNDYKIVDETAQSLAQAAQSTAESKLLTAQLNSNYTSSTKTLTLSLVTTKQ